jgi:adenine-specific DNA-methyltransferase
MVAKLFRNRAPRAHEILLDPGCGPGTFIEGVVRWCNRNGSPIPRIVGIDSDSALLSEAGRGVGTIEQVTLLHEDFLVSRSERYDYVIGNPPYVPITGLSVEERTDYRRRYRTARGRFDLYLLFFEQALTLLKPDGRLVFVTPEKFLYVQTAEPLRRALADVALEEIEFIDESAFPDLVTYPVITTITGKPPTDETRVTLRDGSTRSVQLDRSGASWLPRIRGSGFAKAGPVLADAFLRISCGVATGADNVYVVDDDKLDQSLRPFAFPTIAGRRLSQGEEIITRQSMLIPYALNGALLDEAELGPLGAYLREPSRYARLMQRTCVARKPWYAFHENPPLEEMLQPKILCKDIGSTPWFVVDGHGGIVPRHSVYYLVPRDSSLIHEICEYLNSEEAREWLLAHCQRAANGFVRLQSHVLKRMPLPEHFVSGAQLSLV